MHFKPIVLPTLAAAVVAALALALAPSRSASTGGHSTAVATGQTARISIHNYAFIPQTLTVKVGTVITVTNTDSTQHTATAQDRAFDSGTLAQGKTAHFTVSKPGTYAYYCQFHAFMTGTIKVIG
ncbi:MAG: cupredoxin domain-containing protein [Solirubrobacteraceae bacterium]